MLINIMVFFCETNDIELHVYRWNLIYRMCIFLVHTSSGIIHQDRKGKIKISLCPVIQPCLVGPYHNIKTQDGKTYL